MTDVYDIEKMADALDFGVTYQPTSQSTQQDSRQGRANGSSAPRLYLADHQTAAVGRFGRPFYVEAGSGIYMTLHLPVSESPQTVTSYTLIVAAAITTSIQDLTDKICQIKWVNDIYLGQKKIAGILTESLLDPETGLVSDLLIGVGLNFQLTDVPEDLSDKAGSLFADQPAIRRQDLVIAIWQTFFQTSREDLLETYKTHSLVLGRQISFEQAGQELTGQALDLDDQGQLLVQLESGEKIKLHSGEISLIDWTRK